MMKIVNGEEFYIGWRFKWANLTPKNLTDYSVLVQIRPFKTSSSVIDSFDQDDDEIIFVPEAGAVDLHLPPSVTNNYTFKKAVIDCWVFNDADTDGDRSPTIDLVFDSGVSR